MMMMTITVNRLLAILDPEYDFDVLAVVMNCNFAPLYNRSCAISQYLKFKLTTIA